MPRNHFSSDIPEAVWWTQQLLMEPTPKGNSQFNDNQNHRAAANPSMFCGQNTAFSFNLNQEDDEALDEQLTDERENPTKAEFQEQFEVEKEPMFEKPLTPSDVGKLNRLVIPKQHAEKYFPLGGGGCDSGEKGFLLSFEDESGKSWRFRYSYWNSSQSYVLTKGWSRFVKEKRLDAGDVVLFERHRVDGDRLFIGWRRRSTPTSTGQENKVAQPAAVVVKSGGGGWSQVFYSAYSYPSHPYRPPTPYQPNCLHAGSVVQNQTTPSGNSKRLRLFGVNLECQPDESEPYTPDGSSMSSQSQSQSQSPSQGQGHYQYCTNAHASYPQTDKDINFSGDVSQMRYHQG